MKNLLRFTVLIVFLVLADKARAQFAVTSYSFYAIGVNTTQNKKLSGDILVEADLFYHFNPGAYHRFSVGAGINTGPFRGFDPINALTIPLELEIYPLQNFKRFSVIVELTPELMAEGDPFLRSLWGIRYTFGD